MNPNNPTSASLVAALLASALMITLSACETQGPLEEAGEEIDDALEDARDILEDDDDRR